LRALRHGWTTVLVVVLVGVAVGAGLTLKATKVYQASAQVSLPPAEQSLVPAVADRVWSYVPIAADPVVTSAVIEKMRIRLTEEQLGRKITATPSAPNGLVEIRVTDHNRLRAARLANVVAAEFNRIVTKRALPHHPGAPRVKLTITRPAAVPGTPITPRPVVNIGLGGLIGLVLGAALVVVLTGLVGVRGARAPAHPVAGRVDVLGRQRPRSDRRDPDKRRDIQGLRALAVGLVVLFHAGWSLWPGGFIGVDVFFVISGFLITGNISRGLATGGFTLLGFYANRARRLLPAAFVTIASTCSAAYLLLPPERFDTIGRDALASAYYVVNWRLSAQSIDYLAENQAPSPFQHFWSLAVEEQYYLVWPLLLLIAYLVTLRAGRRIGLLVAAGLILVPSLVYSVTYTFSSPSQAYFVTTTRMWELAVGGVVALTAGLSARLPQVLAAAIGWLGVAGIVYSALVYTGATPFPGYAAGLPVLCAAAVILAGPAAGPIGPVAILGRSVPVFLGNISYSLYLWHWPIIVFLAARLTGALPLWAGLLAAAGSIVPAYLSYRFVESPGMRLPTFATTGGGLRLGLLTTMSSAVAGLLLLVFIPHANVAGVSVNAYGVATDVQGRVVKAGAEVLRADPRGDPAGAPLDRFSSITPDPLTSRTEDIPGGGGGCTLPQNDAADHPCVFGAKDSDLQIDLVGDSHAMQWEPALAAAALANNWRVVTHTKGGCPFNAATFNSHGLPWTACTDWNREVTRVIIAERPHLVITSELGDLYKTFKNGRLLSGPQSQEQVIEGYTNAWRPLTAAGLSVVALAETPHPLFDIPSCVSENLRHLSTCAGPRSEMIHASTAQEIAVHRTPGVAYLDLNDIVCPTSRCAAVVGGVMVYRDSDHISATYARTAAGYFAAKIAPSLKQ
jgi:peptidoglycan/LPS O-acetylase OafA/YrhL/capsular polysaccharide biosynthesis protein